MKKYLTSIKFYFHGMLVAGLGAASSVLIGGLQTGSFPTSGQLKQDGIVALCAGLGYLIKVLTAGSSAPTQDTTPPEQAVKP